MGPSLVGFVLSWLLDGIVPDEIEPLCLVPTAACAAGMIVSILKLRCPYFGKGIPWGPAFWPSEKTRHCSRCGRPFVYDDEV